MVIQHIMKHIGFVAKYINSLNTKICVWSVYVGTTDYLTYVYG